MRRRKIVTEYRQPGGDGERIEIKLWGLVQNILPCHPLPVSQDVRNCDWKCLYSRVGGCHGDSGCCQLTGSATHRRVVDSQRQFRRLSSLRIALLFLFHHFFHVPLFHRNGNTLSDSPAVSRRPVRPAPRHLLSNAGQKRTLFGSESVPSEFRFRQLVITVSSRTRSFPDFSWHL